jgi:drug/metabolite transporter (DMT)-like permease
VLGSALAIGATILTFIVGIFDHFPSAAAAGLPQFGAALWLGPLGSTATYLIWALIARTATVPSMVLTLFIQPVLGAALGFWLLGERLTWVRFSGAAMILTGISFLLLRELRRTPAI